MTLDHISIYMYTLSIIYARQSGIAEG